MVYKTFKMFVDKEFPQYMKDFPDDRRFRFFLLQD